jgi:hypothetical protein
MQAGQARVVDTLQKFPWLGWAIWAVHVAAVLALMHPRRFGAAFAYYIGFAAKLRAEQPVYDPASLGDVAYSPVSLLLFFPVTELSPTTAATISFAIFAALFTYAAIALTRALFDDHPDAVWLAGFLLAANVLPGWYHFKQVQLHIPMTAAMMLGVAAMMRARWTLGAVWLSVALVAKLHALVLILLAGALVPRMRLVLLVGIIVGVALPFVFLPAGYMVEQYRLFGLKLWSVATAPPGEWIYQADFTTLLRAFGIVLPGAASLVIRLAAALGTLWLAWNVQRSGDRKAFALALLLLAGLYITLFGPRNENVSFLVLTPAITALAFALLRRDPGDWRGWLLILACQALGFVVALPVDAVTKPAITAAIYVWAAFLMTRAQRWCGLFEAPQPGAAATAKI